MSSPLIVVFGNTVVMYDLNGAEAFRFDHPEAEVVADKLKHWSLRLVKEAALETLRVTRIT